MEESVGDGAVRTQFGFYGLEEGSRLGLFRRREPAACLYTRTALHTYTLFYFCGSQSWTLYTGPLRATSHTLHFTLCTYLDHFPSHTSCLAHRRGGGIHGQWQSVMVHQGCRVSLFESSNFTLSQGKQKCQHLVHVQYLIHR